MCFSTDNWFKFMKMDQFQWVEYSFTNFSAAKKHIQRF